MDFRLTRRSLLASALPTAALADTGTIAPDGGTLSWDKLPGQITLPPWGAHTMALAMAGGDNVTSVALSDRATDSRIEILLVANHDGKQPRILALEVLQWEAPGGRLTSRPVADREGGRVIFDRNGSLRRTATQWQREVWRDFLAWDGSVLVDQPVRKPLAGTMQAALGEVRARTYAWLATPRQGLTAQDLAALGLNAGSFGLR